MVYAQLLDRLQGRRHQPAAVLSPARRSVQPRGADQLRSRPEDRPVRPQAALRHRRVLRHATARPDRRYDLPGGRIRATGAVRGAGQRRQRPREGCRGRFTARPVDGLQHRWFGELPQLQLHLAGPGHRPSALGRSAGRFARSGSGRWARSTRCRSANRLAHAARRRQLSGQDLHRVQVHRRAAVHRRLHARERPPDLAEPRTRTCRSRSKAPT